MVFIDRPTAPSGEDLSDHFPIRANINDLSVISYNLQFLPSFLSHKKDISATIHEMARYVGDVAADVCCVQELFDRRANNDLVVAMSARGYVATDLVGAGWMSSVFNGGVRIFVRSEHATILEQHHYVYRNKIDYFVGADAMVNKGVSHLVLTKNGKKHHIFNTHLQAFYEGREYYSEITLAQCVELQAFIEKQKTAGIIRAGEGVILCGDFNIDKTDAENEAGRQFKKMTHILGTGWQFLDFSRTEGSPEYTYSSQNTHNTTHHWNENLDMIIAQVAGSISRRDQIVRQYYANIQVRIARFIARRATLFSFWRLSAQDTETLRGDNRQIVSLMRRAEMLQAARIHPADSVQWRSEAEAICPHLSPPGPIKKMLLPVSVCLAVAMVFLFYSSMAALMLLAASVAVALMRVEDTSPGMAEMAINSGTSGQMLGILRDNADVLPRPLWQKHAESNRAPPPAGEERVRENQPTNNSSWCHSAVLPSNSRPRHPAGFG